MREFKNIVKACHHATYHRADARMVPASELRNFRNIVHHGAEKHIIRQILTTLPANNF